MSQRVVLLVNLGTPLSPKPKDVKRYLNEFLTDGRVIDIPWLPRQLLVKRIIVPRRYKMSAKTYQELWTKEGSPLLVHSRGAQAALQKKLGARYKVHLAMRYQFPGLKDVLSCIERDGPCEELIILPMFPQYASATTGSINELVMKTVQNWQTVPSLQLINTFAEHPAFIQAWADVAKPYNVNSYDHILMSFHGLPERQIKKADSKSVCLTGTCCQTLNSKNLYCYKAQCYATARALADKLSIKNYTVCFQSRLGKSPWIQPYASDVLKECANRKQKKLLVFSPAFVTDCLETTIEIGEEYAEEFEEMGGEQLDLVPSLNTHPSWIQALHTLVKERETSSLQKIKCT